MTRAQAAAHVLAALLEVPRDERPEGAPSSRRPDRYSMPPDLEGDEYLFERRRLMRRERP